MKKPSRLVGAFTAILACGVSLLAVSHGAPPGGGGSTTPAGTIYYGAAGNIWKMKPDGSSKQIVSPLLTSESAWAQSASSAKSYGGSRWHLILEEVQSQTITVRYDDGDIAVPCRELFACRWTGNSWQKLQITDFNRDGLRDASYSSGETPMAWSNDGSDSFLSVRQFGWEVAADGAIIYSAVRPRYIIRINLSGAELTAYAGGNSDLHLPLRANDPRCTVAAMQSADRTSDATFTAHAWSPDGLSLVYSETPDPASVYYTTNLYRFNLDSGDPLVDTATDVLLYAAGDQFYTRASWSPDGTRIAVHDGWDVYLVTPQGTGRTAFLSSAQAYHSHVYWSPDSKWLVYRKLTSTRQICRKPVAGGKEVVLTKDLGGAAQWTLGWTAE